MQKMSTGLQTIMQVEHHLLKCLGPEVFQISDFFWNLDIYRYLMRGAWDPSLNMKFMFHTYLHTLPEGNFIQYFQQFVHETKFVLSTYMRNFPLVVSGQHSESFRFWSNLNSGFLDCECSTCISFLLVKLTMFEIPTFSQ